VGKKREDYRDENNVTWVAQLIAWLGGAALLSYGEFTMNDVQNSEDLHSRRLPGWQVHMGSICLGVAAFVIILFFLELLGRRSKTIAWRVTWPWLPLVAFAGLATLIHIPLYIFVPAAVIHVVWAYRWTRIAR
jgi:hypothetical protein